MPLNHPHVTDPDATGHLRETDGRKILAAIDEAFMRDPHINEFGMLLTEGQISIEDARLAAGVSRGGRDEADIIVLAGCVLLMQHKLAVAYWSLPLLLPSVGRDMMALAAVPNWWSDPASADRMLRLSRAMLLVVADNATAWNHRKRAIQHSGHCRLDELTFVNLVQSKHQKSQETWAHRRWLIAPLLVDGSAACACPHHKERRKVSTELSPTTPSPQEIWEQELAATERAAILYRKNYNAWTHRMFVASHMPPVQLPELIKRARKHSRMNVSDHAAHHFRCVIIQQHAHNLLRKGGLGSEQDAQLMVSQEQAVTEELIVTFPGHQSLWLSLRWLLNVSLSVDGRPPGGVYAGGGVGVGCVERGGAVEGEGEEEEGAGLVKDASGVDAIGNLEVAVELWMNLLRLQGGEAEASEGAGEPAGGEATEMRTSKLEARRVLEEEGACRDEGRRGLSTWLVRQLLRTLEFARLRYQDTERAHASTERLQALLLAGWVLRKFRIHQSEWCRCAEGVRAGDRGGASMLKQLESLISNSLQDLAPFQKEAWQTCLFDTCGHAGETQ